jgi:hypothetical protein
MGVKRGFRRRAAGLEGGLAAVSKITVNIAGRCSFLDHDCGCATAARCWSGNRFEKRRLKLIGQINVSRS